MPSQHPGHVHVEYQCEVESLLTAGEVTSRGLQPSSITPGGPPGVSEGEQWPVYVVLTNGKVFGCDLLVSATGAYPNTDCLAGLSGDIEVCVGAMMSQVVSFPDPTHPERERVAHKIFWKLQKIQFNHIPTL